jgi:hypothetical protein
MTNGVNNIFIVRQCRDYTSEPTVTNSVALGTYAQLTARATRVVLETLNRPSRRGTCAYQLRVVHQGAVTSRSRSCRRSSASCLRANSHGSYTNDCRSKGRVARRFLVLLKTRMWREMIVTVQCSRRVAGSANAPYWWLGVRPWPGCWVEHTSHLYFMV